MSGIYCVGATVSLFTLTIVASVVLFIAVGNFAGRRVKNLDDYLVAGRRAPTLLIVGTLVASLMSTTVFMGEAGFTYAGQLGPYLLLPGLTVTGYVYGALFFGTYLRRSQATTCLLYTSPSPRDQRGSRMPSSA